MHMIRSNSNNHKKDNKLILPSLSVKKSKFWLFYALLFIFLINIIKTIYNCLINMIHRNILKQLYHINRISSLRYGFGIFKFNLPDLG